MAWFNLQFFASLSYCVSSFILYTLLIIMLLRNWKDYNSAFFKITIADFLFNLFTYLNSMITLRVPNGTCRDCLLSNFFAGLGQNNTETVNFLYLNYFFHFGNAYFQYSMTTLMSLNRTTAIFYYVSNEKIWQIIFPLSILLMTLICVYFTRTILFSTPYFLYNDSLDFYAIKSDVNILSAYYNVIWYMAFAVVSSIVLNTLSVIKLKLMQQKLSTVERNLLYSTVVSSVIQCLAAANTFLLQLDMSRTTFLGQFAQLMLPFSSDLLTVSQPFVLIFMSSKVRNGMVQMYLPRNSKISAVLVKTATGARSSGGSHASQIGTTRY